MRQGQGHSEVQTPRGSMLVIQEGLERAREKEKEREKRNSKKQRQSVCVHSSACAYVFNTRLQKQ